MKKKSLLYSGLAVLGLAVGVTSYAVTAGLPGITLTAEGDDEVTYAEAVAKYPTPDGYCLPNTVAEVAIEYASVPVANFSADKEILIEIDKSTSTAENVEEYEKIASTSASVSINAETKQLVAKLSAPLAAGTYYANIPEGVVTVDGAPNAAARWMFTVKAAVAPSANTNGVTYPASNSTVASYQEVSTLWVNYAVGDAPLTINRNCTGNVVVKHEGETLYTFAATDEAHVTTDSKWSGEIVIKLPEPLVKAGKYTVEIPAGLATANGLNAAYSWSFNVQEELAFETSVNAGSTYSFATYNEVTVTWPEGTALTLNAGKKVALVNVKSGASSTVVNYTASVAGNVLTLKADSMDDMVVAGAINNYLQLVLPAGLVKVVKGDLSYENSAVSLTPLYSAAFANSDFKFTPSLDEAVTLDDIKEIVIDVPEGAVYCGGKIVGSTNILTMYPGASANATYYYQYKFKELSEDGKKLTVELAAAAATTSQSNNPTIIENGPSNLKWNANLFQIEGKNLKSAQSTMPGYAIKGGLEISPIYNSAPKNYAAETSITGLTLYFPLKVVVNNPDAEITLSKDGKTLVTVKAGDTTTAAAKVGGAGHGSPAYANLFKVEGEAITEPGVYTYHVPADAFIQVEGQPYKNVATDIMVYIGENLPYTVTPATAKYTAELNAKGNDIVAGSLVCTPGNDATELTEMTLVYADDAVIKLLPGYESKLSSGGANKVAGKYVIPETKQALTASPQSGYEWDDVKVEGNKVTFTLKKPYNLATPSGFATFMLVPAGVYEVTAKDAEGVVKTYANAKTYELYQPLPMAQGKIGTVAVDAKGMADIQYMTPESNYIMTSDLSQIIYTGYETIYPAAVKPLATLRDIDTDEVIATYTGKKPAESLYLNGLSVSFTPDAEYTETVAALGTGTYKFVIEKETLQGGGSSATSTLKVLNSSDFVYEIKTLTASVSVAPESGETIKGVGGLSKLTLTYEGVSVLVANPDVKPMVYVKKKIEEGIYAGDLYDYDLAQDGYSVDFKITKGEYSAEEQGIALLADGDVEDPMQVQTAEAEITITPALTEQDTYYVFVPAGIVKMETVIASPSATYSYNVIPPVDFEGVFTPLMPAFDFNLADSYEVEEGQPMGMGYLILGAAEGVTLNNECTEKVQLLYKGEQIAEIGAFMPPTEPETPETPEEGGEEENAPATQADETDEPSAEEPADDAMLPAVYEMEGMMAFIFAAEQQPEFLKGGEYTVVIPTGLFVKGDQLVVGGELTYHMTLPSVPFADAITYSIPGAEFTISDTYGAAYGVPFGMGIVQLKAIDGVVLGEDVKESIKLYYGDRVIAEAAADEGSIQFNGIGSADDLDPGMITSQNTILINFQSESTPDQLFKQEGEYKIEVPAGFFVTADGANVEAGSLAYKMNAPELVDYKWTMTPASGAEFTREIKDLTFNVEGAKFVDYDKGFGFLYNPEGEKMSFKSSYPKSVGQTGFFWSLEENPNKPQEWNDGTYTFKIDKFTLWVDVYADYDTPANFPLEDIVVTYELRDGKTAVAAIGLDRADAYDVYTLDGKAVVLNGNSDDLIDLEPGMYIINGKKVVIRK